VQVTQKNVAEDVHLSKTHLLPSANFLTIPYLGGYQTLATLNAQLTVELNDTKIFLIQLQKKKK
jgi:hypothetical protein